MGRLSYSLKESCLNCWLCHAAAQVMNEHNDQSSLDDGPRHENLIFAYAKTKALISCEVTDQRLCFRYIDRTIPLLPKSEISNI